MQRSLWVFGASAAVLAVMVWVDLTFGPNTSILGLFAVLGVGATHQTWKKWWARKETDRVDPETRKQVRLDASSEQLHEAFAIGQRLGWDVEEVEAKNASFPVSIQFSPTDDASSSRELITALIEAGIAHRVSP